MNTLPQPSILVVDDDDDIRLELVEYLLDEGMPVVSAGDVPSGLRCLEAAGPGGISVVVTDVKMPGRDGISFAQELLDTIKEADALEVIIITGHGNFALALQTIRMRAFDLIPKPMFLASVAESVRRAHARAMERRRAAQGNSEAADLLAARETALSTEIAVSLDKANTAFLRTVRHGLRTPLVPVIGLSELIEEKAGQLAPDQLLDYARMIREAGEKLQCMIDTMLTINALQRNGITGPLEPVAIADLLNAAATDFAGQAAQRGQMILVGPGATGTLMSKRRYLCLAIDELVRNALRFGPEGRPIELDAKLADGHVVISVTDHGPGMTADEIEAVRHAFTKQDMSMTQASSGLGLGLTLAETAAQALGGRLDLAYTPAEGMVARLVVPAA